MYHFDQYLTSSLPVYDKVFTLQIELQCMKLDKLEISKDIYDNQMRKRK